MELDYDAVFWLATHSGEGPDRASQIAHAATPGSYELAWARCYASSLGDPSPNDSQHSTGEK